MAVLKAPIDTPRYYKLTPSGQWLPEGTPIMLDASASVEQGEVVDAEDKIYRDFKHIVDNYEKIACDEIVTVYDFYKLLAGPDSGHGPVYAVIVMEMYPVNLLEYLIGYFKKHRQPVPPQVAATLGRSDDQ